MLLEPRNGAILMFCLLTLRESKFFVMFSAVSIIVSFAFGLVFRFANAFATVIPAGVFTLAVVTPSFGCNGRNIM